MGQRIIHGFPALVESDLDWGYSYPFGQGRAARTRYLEFVNETDEDIQIDTSQQDHEESCPKTQNHELHETQAHP